MTRHAQLKEASQTKRVRRRRGPAGLSVQRAGCRRRRPLFVEPNPSGKTSGSPVWAVAGQENTFGRDDLAYDDRDGKALKRGLHRTVLYPNRVACWRGSMSGVLNGHVLRDIRGCAKVVS